MRSHPEQSHLQALVDELPVLSLGRKLRCVLMSLMQSCPLFLLRLILGFLLTSRNLLRCPQRLIASGLRFGRGLPLRLLCVTTRTLQQLSCLLCSLNLF